MALRLTYWILFFNLLLLMCDHGNGARDIVAKQDWKQVEMTDQPDSASHETTSGTKESDYITAYRTTDAKKSGYVAQGGYAAAYSYSSKQDAKDSYITAYGTKEASKDSEMEHKKHCDHANGRKDVPKQHLKDAKNLGNVGGYAAAYSYGSKQDAKDSYITAYQTRKDAKDNYITAYTKQDAKDGYVTPYGTKDASKNSRMEHKKHGEVEDGANNLKQGKVENRKKMDQPYIAGYNKNREANYITSSTSQATKDSYITKYETKEASKNSGMEHKKHVTNKKEMDQPYIAGYNRNKEANYFTSYGTKEDAKDNYITAYTRQDAKNSYITQYGDASKNSRMDHQEHDGAEDVTNEKEVDQPYIAGYNRNKEANYITSYGTREDAKDKYTTAYTRQDAKNSYITQYGDASKNSRMDHQEHDGVEDVTNQKEMDQPYIAGYKKDAKDNYMAQYGTRQEAKESPIQESDQSYIAGYRNKQEVKESNYITSYGDREESKSSVIEHENNMTTKPSSHMDHLGAFKSGFFTMDDLFVGNIMPLYFPIQELSEFLPREEADSIPFSMPQLPNVLQLFSIPIDSPNARAMEDTLQQCEATPITGETKLCATSLESMLAFVHSIMGSWANLNVLTTKHPTMSTALTQNYDVLRVSKELYAPKWVACHPLPYPYKIFFCHFIENTKIFKVLLGGENGHKVEAVAVCHMDTSDWDPNHILFRQLGVKPGSSPLCHFLPKYHLVWVPSPTTASI
ncbi:BURP domain-containing protein 12 isoform X2 [Quercus suber]|uniref:BURP domain-containing protein 12 isoform X2 n=1 Tax=Quercus suber TaxID=58331 RepID=UPI0032E00ACB